ncbi:MAG: TIGR02147 family protein [Pseudobdellovibrionaceae bacterium]
MKTVYDFKRYLDFLKNRIEENRETRGYQTKLAEAAGCQKAFISQVLGGTAHFSLDHGIALGIFWNLSEDESEYFLTLIQLERAGTHTLRSYLDKRLARMRQAKMNISERLRKPKLDKQAEETVYYSSWMWSAIHMAVAIPEMSTTAAIANRLGLPENTVHMILGRLVEMGLIKKKAKGWDLTESFLHLPRNSFMSEAHNISWRQKSIESLQRQDQSSLQYSAVFTLSQDVFEELKMDIIADIEKLNSKIAPSKSEHLSAFTCSFFKL